MMPECGIHEIVGMVENGDISIPELQRGFVWTDEKIKDLVHSIYRGYPLGLITLYKLPRHLRDEIGVLNWVLDGQQRLLALTLILNGYVDLADGRRKELWIWFNPVNDNLQVTTPPRKLRDPWVKLSDFLKLGRREYEKFIEGKSIEEKEKIDVMWTSFRDFKVLYHEISEELELDELGDIFVRANFAGTRVRGADVYSTMIAITQRGLVKELRGFADELKRTLGWEIDYGILIRTFIAFSTSGRVKLAGRVLDQAEKLREVFESTDLPYILKKVKDNIQKSVEMLRDKFKLIEPTHIYFPTENVLVTMAYYLGKRGALSSMEEKGLLTWFVLASEFGRYSSATETRLNEDLSVIEEGGDYKALISEIEEREGNLKERIKSQISFAGWLSRLLLYSILWANEAKDIGHPYDRLHTGDVIIHHIFPRSRLVGSEWEQLIDDVGNITLVSGGTNTRLRDEAPEDYLPRVPSDIRKAHLIPDNSHLWEMGNFKRFLEERKKLLMDSVDKLLG